jgi:class 3 adenylate cyclase
MKVVTRGQRRATTVEGKPRRIRPSAHNHEMYWEEHHAKRKKKLLGKWRAVAWSITGFYALLQECQATTSSRLDSFACFVPKMVTKTIRTIEDPKKLDSNDPLPTTKFAGVIVFADISGFTKLTGRLEKEKDGAAKLTQILNGFFGVLIEGMTAAGGDIAQFSGDAITVVFPEPEGVEAVTTATALTALKASIAGHHLCNRHADSIGEPLRLHIGVGCGGCDFAHVGGQFGRWECVLSGAPFGQIKYAVPLASLEETVISPEMFVLLKDYVGGNPVDSNCFNVVTVEGVPHSAHTVWLKYVDDRIVACEIAIPQHVLDNRDAGRKTSQTSSSNGKPKKDYKLRHSMSATKHRSSGTGRQSLLGGPIRSQLAVNLDGLDQQHLPLFRRYIPGAVHKAIMRGQEATLASMRLCSVMFIEILGADVTTIDGWGLQAVMEVVQSCVYLNEGSVNKLIIDDKGLLILCAWGLPPLAHSDDPARATDSANLICSSIGMILEGQDAVIGVATGLVFCGVVGSNLRREYTTMGNAVNMSARLMCKAEPGNALVDQRTMEQSKKVYAFVDTEPLQLKGFDKPTLVFKIGEKLDEESSDSEEDNDDSSLANSSLALRDGSKFVNILKEQLRVGGGCMLLAGERGSGKFVILHKMLQESKLNGVTCLIGQSGTKGGSREMHNAEMTEWKEVVNGLMYALIDHFVDSQGEYITLLRLKNTGNVLEIMKNDKIEPHIICAFGLWAKTVDAYEDLGPWKMAEENAPNCNLKWEDVFDATWAVTELVTILKALLPETHHDEMPCLAPFFTGISNEGSGTLRRRAEFNTKLMEERKKKVEEGGEEVAADTPLRRQITRASSLTRDPYEQLYKKSEGQSLDWAVRRELMLRVFLRARQLLGPIVVCIKLKAGSSQTWGQIVLSAESFQLLGAFGQYCSDQGMEGRAVMERVNAAQDGEKSRVQALAGIPPGLILCVISRPIHRLVAIQLQDHANRAYQEDAALRLKSSLGWDELQSHVLSVLKIEPAGLPAEVLGWVARIGGFQPLHSEQILRHWVAAGQLEVKDGVAKPLVAFDVLAQSTPPTLQGHMREAFDVLSPSQQGLLKLLACIEEPISQTLVFEMMLTDEHLAAQHLMSQYEKDLQWFVECEILSYTSHPTAWTHRSPEFQDTKSKNPNSNVTNRSSQTAKASQNRFSQTDTDGESTSYNNQEMPHLLFRSLVMKSTCTTQMVDSLVQRLKAKAVKLQKARQVKRKVAAMTTAERMVWGGKTVSRFFRYLQAKNGRGRWAPLLKKMQKSSKFTWQKDEVPHSIPSAGLHVAPYVSAANADSSSPLKAKNKSQSAASGTRKKSAPRKSIWGPLGKKKTERTKRAFKDIKRIAFLKEDIPNEAYHVVYGSTVHTPIEGNLEKLLTQQAWQQKMIKAGRPAEQWHKRYFCVWGYFLQYFPDERKRLPPKGVLDLRNLVVVQKVRFRVNLSHPCMLPIHA